MLLSCTGMSTGEYAPLGHTRLLGGLVYSMACYQELHWLRCACHVGIWVIA